MKYFVVSDIHSFASELKLSLKNAGFDFKNKEHILIVCGDIFDRGPDSLEVYNIIKSIPKSRRILIRGNHELLYFELLDKKFPESHDFHNKTVDTFCQIAKYNPECLNGYNGISYFGSDIINDSQLYWEQIKSIVKTHPITKWLKSNEWKDYYELNNKYIFVHSFIPTKLKEEVVKKFGIYAYGFENPDCYEYDPNWRSSLKGSWEIAVWGCPWSQYNSGLFKPEEDQNRTLVCGHWHTPDFYKHLKNIKNHDGDIYYSKGIIGIDGGVYIDPCFGDYVHPQNVLVIDENMECFDQFGIKLVEEKNIPIIKTVSEGE